MRPLKYMFATTLAAGGLLGSAGAADAAALDQNHTLTGTAVGEGAVGSPPPPPNLTPSPGAILSEEMAQTFTVGVSGYLSQIDAFLWNPGSPHIGVVTATIFQVDGLVISDIIGAPSLLLGAALATSSVPISSVPDGPAVCCVFPEVHYTSFIYSPDGLQVSVGEVLAVELSVTPNQAELGPSWLTWASSDSAGDNSGPTYAGGAAFALNNVFSNGPTAYFWDLIGEDTEFGFRTYVEPIADAPEPSALAILSVGLLNIAMIRRQSEKRDE